MKPPTQRERAGDFIRSHSRFTIADIEACGVGRSTAQNVVNELKRSGHVRVLEAQQGALRGRVNVYEVVASPPAKPTSADGRQLAWTAIRILRTFTVGDLQAHSGISRTNATSFVSLLVKSGHIRPEGRKQPNGTPGSFRLYRLLRDTGPVAPLVKGRPTSPRGEVRHG